MTTGQTDSAIPKMLLRSAAGGALIAATLLYWPMGEAKPPTDGSAALVQVYTTRNCGYCKLLRRYLNARGIHYTEYDIETNRTAWLAFKCAGAQGVPFVVIGGQRIHGFNPAAIEKALAGAEAAVASARAQSGPG